MAGDMMEARKHIEALFRVIGGVHGAFGAESCEYCASVSAAQAFLTRLDGEGQRVEDPAFDAALAKVIRERMPGLASDAGDDWQAKFKGHTEAVQGFLAEMLAVYDPCASGEMHVRDICAFLVKQATDDRQRFYDQEAELTRQKAEQSDIRNAALEEAAMAADDEVAFWHGFSPACETAGKRIAAAIRALISQPNGGQT
jgi:hypothetical protein